MDSPVISIIILINLLVMGGFSPIILNVNGNEWKKDTNISFQDLNTSNEYYHIYNRSDLPLYYNDTLRQDPSIFFYQVSNAFNDETEYKSNEKTSIRSTSSSEAGLMDSAWPMYCHDNRHTGQSPYSTENVTGIELWRFYQVGHSLGSPVIDKNGTIYFPGFMSFFAINPNGTEQLKVRIYYMSESGCAIDKDGVCYFGVSRDSGRLYAINPNGTIRWSLHLADILSSPAIGTDGTIYISTEDSTYPTTRGSIYAINQNGSVRWRHQTNHVVYSSPAIGSDGTVYCGCHDQNLYAFYPENGTVKWTFHTGGWIRVSPCIAIDGTIYIVSLDSYLYAINPNGTQRWRVSVGAGTSPTIGKDGTIYCGWKQLFAVNPNGTVRWIFNPNTGGAIQGGTPCHSADGSIYLGMSDGILIAVNHDGTEQWRKKLGAVIESAPAIGEDGAVYICSGDDEPINEWGSLRSKGYLHAFRQPTQNTRPNDPTALIGPIAGKINKNYMFTTLTIDPDLNPVSFMVDWGDGTTPTWSKDYASNETAHLFHKWEYAGTYTVRVKARDTLGAESNWSAPINVTIQANLYIRSYRGGLGIHVLIESNSNTTLYNLTLKIGFGVLISLLVPWGGRIEKTIPVLKAGEKKRLHAWVFGFGRDMIYISVGDDDEDHPGTILGPFVFFDSQVSIKK